MMLEQVSNILKNAFSAAGIDPALAIVVPSDRQDVDYQCNGIRPAAGRSGIDAITLALDVVNRIDNNDVASFSISTLGHININLKAEALEILTAQPFSYAKTGQKIIIDFGGPNVAKPMHVGHLRSLVIGDSLQRILKFVGNEVISDIHLGDWGLQMGLLLAVLKDEPLNNITIDRLETEYPLASSRAKTDPEFQAEAQNLTQRLQYGDPKLTKVWEHFTQISLAEIDRELETLNINFDLYKGESSVQSLIPGMIASFKDGGIAQEDNGALVVAVGTPPLVLQKSDGAALYATTDLATIIDRVSEFRPDQIIYVTDSRQALHFQQVFKASEMGNLFDGKLTHVKFGTVNGPDGKPLKTRAGGVPKLYDLIVEAVTKAAAINPECAHEVGIAALKFADLQNHPSTSYQFDMDRFLSFEGKTGPYLLYQAVRIKSMLAKAAAPGPLKITEEDERRLAVKVAVGFPEALGKAVAKLSPKEVADYAYDLAQTFSKFYANYQIADNGSRVMLALLVLDRLETCLYLLGLQIPKRM